MTETSFLIDLILNHKLPKATRQTIADRITELAAALPAMYVAPAPPRQAISPPLEAQTQAGLVALQQRQAAIDNAMAGKQGSNYKVRPK